MDGRTYHKTGACTQADDKSDCGIADTTFFFKNTCG